MGKARTSHDRNRAASEYDQLLIGDYLDEQEEEASNVGAVQIVDRGGAARIARSAGPVTGVRVIEPKPSVPVPAAAVASPAAAASSPAATPPIIPPRTRSASPAVMGAPGHLRRPVKRFRWGRLMAGFLTSFIPGAGLLLLIAYLAR